MWAMLLYQGGDGLSVFILLHSANVSHQLKKFNKLRDLGIDMLFAREENV
jgi:hypothetical protein